MVVVVVVVVFLCCVLGGWWLIGGLSLSLTHPITDAFITNQRLI